MFGAALLFGAANALQRMEDEGLKIAMGTDIAGGHGIGIYRQVARAVQLSKLKEFYEPQESKTITITQAFYHATKESGSVFGKVGSFEKGYAFNALVIDNMEDPWTKMTAEEKLERFCYIGDDRNIKARYIDGELLEQEF
jgi:guanine deaminase